MSVAAFRLRGLQRGSVPTITQLSTNTDNTSTANVSTSVTGVTGCLLVAARCANDRTATMAAYASPLGPSGGATFGPVYSGTATGGTLIFWYSYVSGYTGSVGAQWTGNSAGRAASAALITGTGPIGLTQSKVGTASTTGTTYSVTLDSTPDPYGLVVGAVAGEDSGGITPGGTFGELADVLAGTNRALQTQADTDGSATTTVDWSALTDTLARVGIAAEFKNT